MSLIKNKYRVSSITIVITIFLIITSFYVISFYKINDIYSCQTEETIIDIKRTFISDTINNLIYEIGVEKSNNIIIYKNILNRRYNLINSWDKLSYLDYIDNISKLFKNSSDIEFWTIILYDTQTKEVVYSQSDLDLTNIDIESLPTLLSSYKRIERDDLSLILGISKNYIDTLTKNNILDKIKNLNFNTNSYITVNEVLNYNGGDNYARVLINPKAKSKVGQTISSNILDVNGINIYSQELDELNRYNEVFYTSSLNILDENSSERLVYSKLFKDFNWIISMHIYLDDLENYITKINETSGNIAFKTASLAIIFLILFTIICFFILYIIEKKYLKHSKTLLESQVNKDELTGTISRRGGVLELTKAFSYFKFKKNDVGVMMFDIDKFKTINDTFGHNIGDVVLKEVSKAVAYSIREVDMLIRWGGDEFIVLFYGLKKENALFIGDKIAATIYNLNIPELNGKFNPSISIGFSYFKDDDTSYKDALERADNALYKSKTNGRNQTNITL